MWNRIAIALLSCVAVRSVLAQPFYGQPDRPSISTSGSAEVKVVPDEVEVAVGVESVHRNLQIAHDMNEDVVAKLKAIAKEYRIAADKIQTDFINIEPNYGTSANGTTLLNYTVRRSMVITSSDVARFDQLLAALVGAGANHVHSIQFKTTRLREHRDEARRMAARAAFEKARLLAESLGAKIGKVRSITESQDWWGSSYSSWWGRWGGFNQNVSQNAVANAGSSPGEGSLAAGRISVTANVNVTFELE